MAMKAPAPAASFEPCPSGPQALVLCDVIDCGMVTSNFRGQEPKTQRKVRLRWQSEKKMRDGKPFLVQKQYTWSMHEKANLRKELEQWRGRKFTDQEANDFDLERLLGVNAFGNITHTSKRGAIYADVATLMPPLKDRPKLVVRDYVRVTERPPAPRQGAPGQTRQAGQTAAQDADPFDQRVPGEDDGLEPPPTDVDDLHDGQPAYGEDDIPF